MTGAALVIGYGNALRSDDGLGWHVAERLDRDARLDGATVIRQHQLTPELALDVSRADLLVLVDASRGLSAGAFSIERVEPERTPAANWSHHVGPRSLVALAQELYGRAAEAFIVSVGVDSIAYGDSLSPVVEAGLPRVIDAVVDLVRAQSGLQPTAGPDRA